MAQYKCKCFQLKELVPTKLLSQLGEKRAWLLFDDRILKAADVVREIFGPCTINTPAINMCGLVPFDSAREAKFSPHKFGRALDIHVLSIEKKAAEIQNQDDRKKFKAREYNKVRERLMSDPRLSAINFEDKSASYPDGITWCHMDTYNRPSRLFNA